MVHCCRKPGCAEDSPNTSSAAKYSELKELIVICNYQGLSIFNMHFNKFVSDFKLKKWKMKATKKRNLLLLISTVDSRVYRISIQQTTCNLARTKAFIPDRALQKLCVG